MGELGSKIALRSKFNKQWVNGGLKLNWRVNIIRNEWVGEYNWIGKKIKWEMGELGSKTKLGINLIRNGWVGVKLVGE